MIGLVVGSASLVLGALGVSGRMDRSRLNLYRRSGPVEPEMHRRMQRIGGALLLVAGAFFLFAGVRGVS